MFAFGKQELATSYVHTQSGPLTLPTAKILRAKDPEPSTKLDSDLCAPMSKLKSSVICDTTNSMDDGNRKGECLGPAHRAAYVETLVTSIPVSER